VQVSYENYSEHVKGFVHSEVKILDISKIVYIFHNIFSCVPEKKEIHNSLEQHEGE